MLVVIVIIGILLAIGSSAYINARNHAKRGRAEVQLRELVKAWSAYYQTYQKWPASLNGRTDVVMEYNTMLPLFATLDSGSLNPDNTNAIPFLSIKIKDPEKYCDPWGNPYKISFKNGADQQDIAMRLNVGFPNRDRYR